MDTSQPGWRPAEEHIETPPTRHPVDSTVRLIQRAQAGNDAALQALCLRYLPRLRHWAAGRLPPATHSALDTDDLVQVTLLRAIGNLPRFAPRHAGAFPAYLRRILRNLVCDELRKAHSGPTLMPLEGDVGTAAPSPLDQVLGHEQSEQYEAALAQLSDEDQSLLFLRVEMGLSYREIAEVLDRPSPDAARMATRRAVVRLAGAVARQRRSRPG